MMLYLFGQLALSDSLNPDHDFSEDDFQRLIRNRNAAKPEPAQTAAGHGAPAISHRLGESPPAPAAEAAH